MRLFVMPVTAGNRAPPRVGIRRERNTLQRRKQGPVMISTVTTAVATFVIIAGIWTANLVCYQPSTGDLDPTGPIVLAVVMK